MNYPTYTSRFGANCPRMAPIVVFVFTILTIFVMNRRSTPIMVVQSSPYVFNASSSLSSLASSAHTTLRFSFPRPRLIASSLERWMRDSAGGGRDNVASNNSGVVRFYDPDLSNSSNASRVFRRLAFGRWPPYHSNYISAHIQRSNPDYGCMTLHNVSNTLFALHGVNHEFPFWRVGLALSNETKKIIDVSFKPLNMGTLVDLDVTDVTRVARILIEASQGNLCSESFNVSNTSKCHTVHQLPTGGYWLVDLHREQLGHSLESVLTLLAHYFGSGLMAKKVPIVFPEPLNEGRELINYEQLMKWLWMYLPKDIPVHFVKQRELYAAPYLVFSATAATLPVSPCSFQFMSEYLVPAVLSSAPHRNSRLFRSGRPLPRKIAVLKKRSANRRLVPSMGPQTEKVLREEGFELIDDESPLDERLVLVNNADIVVTTWGSTFTILARLWGCKRRTRPPIKFIIIFPTCSYGPEWTEYLQNRKHTYKVVKDEIVSGASILFSRCLEWSLGNAHCKHIKLPERAYSLDGFTRKEWFQFPSSEELDAPYDELL